MATILLLFLGLAFVGIPLGIVAIVNSAKTKGVALAILLPLSIIALFVNIVGIFGGLGGNISSGTCSILFVSGLVVSIVTLSVAVHYRRKLNNKIFDDKKKEHEESVAQILAKEKSQSDYITEIKRLKELLDTGAITQEEYDLKKSEILNKK